MPIIPTVKIKADNERGYKIVNADDPRAQKPAPKPRGKASKAKPKDSE